MFLKLFINCACVGIPDVLTLTTTVTITTFKCSIPCISIRLPQCHPTNARYSITFTTISYYKSQKTYMFQALMSHHQRVQQNDCLIYWSVACRTAGGRAVAWHPHSINKPLNFLFTITYSVPKNFQQSYYMQETSTFRSRFVQLLYSLMMCQ